MGFLENLQKNNQFPIIFIGSGITQRYFNNAPNWDELLEKIWNESKTSQNYYSKYNELENRYGDDRFLILTELAENLEKIYNQNFLDGLITLHSLNPKQAHVGHISPFRTRIAEIFSELQLNKEKESELKEFKKMLAKARFIVTTNYDELVEKQLKNAIKIRIGNKGLFETAGEYNELYKIHGSVRDVNSIMITKKDYAKMERASAIVNAKILSALTESPILFLGYSLTDNNIKSLLKDLVYSMPSSIDNIVNRIGIINYEPNKENITESKIAESNIYYTEIKTDNFVEVYRTVAKIDQGISPYDLAKFKNAIKELIQTAGEQRKLDQVLIRHADLDNLSEELKKNNLVVAIGDKQYIFRVPTYVDYIKSYFLKNVEDFPFEIAIQFILKTQLSSTLPVAKYIKSKMNIKNKEKEIINNRLKKFNSLKNIQKGIKLDTITEFILTNCKERDALIIYKKQDSIKAFKKIIYIIKNIKNIHKIDELIEYILLNETDEFINHTILRKFFMCYSLLTEEIIQQIE